MYISLYTKPLRLPTQPTKQPSRRNHSTHHERKAHQSNLILFLQSPSHYQETSLHPSHRPDLHRIPTPRRPHPDHPLQSRPLLHQNQKRRPPPPSQHQPFTLGHPSPNQSPLDPASRSPPHHLHYLLPKVRLHHQQPYRHPPVAITKQIPPLVLPLLSRAQAIESGRCKGDLSVHEVGVAGREAVEVDRGSHAL